MTFALKVWGHEVSSSGNIDNIFFETNGTDPICRNNQHTFSQSKSFAKQKGGRLCTSDEISTLINQKSYLS